jgi:hypothetical protein
MKVRMIQSCRGTLDGTSVQDLEEGRDYETDASPRGDRMGRGLIEKGLAVELDTAGNPVQPPVTEEVADASASPENESDDATGDDRTVHRPVAPSKPRASK